MGWNVNCILISEGPQGYLGTCPPHDSEAARQILQRLNLGECVSKGFCDLNEALALPGDRLAVGAYSQGVILCDRLRIIEFVENPSQHRLSDCLALYPDSNLLVVELGSVVNLFGYALYESGKRARAYCGDAERGVVIDRGMIQPEEAPYFTDSEVREGIRYFRSEVAGKVIELTPPEFGETLAFAMMSRFLGRPIDRWEGPLPRLELFQPGRAWGFPWPTLLRKAGR